MKKRCCSLLLAIAIAILVPLGAFSGYLYLLFEKIHVQQVYQRIDTAAEIQMERVDFLFHHYESLLDAMRSRTNLRRMFWEYQQASYNNPDLQARLHLNVSELIGYLEENSSFYLLDPDFRIVVSSQDELEGSLWTSNRDFFDDSEYRIIDFIRTENSFEVRLAQAIDWEGDSLGYIVLGLKGDELLSITEDYRLFGETGETTLGARIINEEEFTSLTRLRFKESSLLNHGNFDKKASPIVHAFLGPEGIVDDNLLDYRYHSVLASTRKFEAGGMEFALLVKMDVEEVNEQLYRLRCVMLFSYFGIAALVFTCLWYLRQRFQILRNR